MVAAVTQAATPNSTIIINPNSTPTQRPSILSNGGNKTRRANQVRSRYLASSPSSTTTTSTCSDSSSSSSFPRRYASHLISRSRNSGSLHTPQHSIKGGYSSSFAGLKRSQSVDRKRLNALNLEHKQGNTGESPAATKMLITSKRSLSVSFQGEAFSLPITKAKSVTTTHNVGRKGTPERRRITPVKDQGVDSRLVDQYRWPAAGRNRDKSQLLCRNFDCSRQDFGVTGSQSIVVDDNRRLSFDLGNAKQNSDANFVNESCFNHNASDNDSVSTGSTSGLHDLGGGDVCKRKSGTRGLSVSARFWQETSVRLRQLQDLGSPLSSSPSTRMGVQSKTTKSERFSSGDGPLASARTTALPVRAAARSASPGKLLSSSSSPMPAISSPSRGRTMSSNSTNAQSILSFSVDLLRRGKLGQDRVLDAHLLRLLYNCYMQWRFVNARADAAFVVQRQNAEKKLWSAWITVSELQHSVTLKRIKLLLLKQKLKLTTIVKSQIAYLEEWSLLDRDHSNSLEGATEAMKASTLRLPVVGNAVANVQNVKDSIGSAVNVMQAAASSICSLSLKVEEMNFLVAELVNLATKERFLLQQCKEFLSILSAFQVKDCSLRTHIIQRN